MNEPVSTYAAITAAIQTTLAVLLVVGVDPDLVAAITTAFIAWTGLGAAIVRVRVTPTKRNSTGRAT